MAEFSERQRDLLIGKIKPATDEESDWLQQHANDDIPESPVPPGEFYGVNPQKMKEDFDDAGEPSRGAKKD